MWPRFAIKRAQPGRAFPGRPEIVSRIIRATDYPVPFPRFRRSECLLEPFFIKYFNIVKCNESWCSLYVVSLTVHYSERFA